MCHGKQHMHSQIMHNNSALQLNREMTRESGEAKPETEQNLGQWMLAEGRRYKKHLMNFDSTTFTTNPTTTNVKYSPHPTAGLNITRPAAHAAFVFGSVQKLQQEKQKQLAQKYPHYTHTPHSHTKYTH